MNTYQTVRVGYEGTASAMFTSAFIQEQDYIW